MWGDTGRRSALCLGVLSITDSPPTIRLVPKTDLPIGRTNRTTMTDRASSWSVTINNPQASDYEDMDMARSKGWKVEGQVEKGETGTTHLQLYVKTPQVRFSALKKAFPRAHIEVARNVAALRNYVAKEETKVADLPEQDSMYPSLNRLWEMVFQKFDIGFDKDGWDQFALMENECVKFYRDSDTEDMNMDPLRWLGEVVAGFIKEGYFVEHHICNPAVRMQWKNFHKEILFRAFRKVRARQQQTQTNVSDTDRQTDMSCVQSALIPVLGDDITNANEEEDNDSQASSQDGSQDSS